MRAPEQGAPARAAGPRAARIAATAVVYFAAARMGLNLAFAADQVTLVWPGTGLALAALFLLGRDVWPGIALAAFAANLLADEPPWTAAGVAVGNTLEAMVAVWALRRLGFRPSLHRLRDVIALVACGALGSTVLSATIGVVSLCAGGVQPWAHAGSLMLTWWIGDGVSDLVIAPAVLVWSDAVRRGLARSRLVEGAALVAATLVLTAMVFAGRPAMWAREYPLHYLVFPVVVWAALRLRQPGVTAVTMLVWIVGIASTLGGHGPFVMETAHESLLMVQLFMAIVAGTGLLLGAAIAERDAAERRRAADFSALELSERRLRLALETGRMAVWDWDLRTGAVDWSDTLGPLHGLPPDALTRSPQGFFDLVHPEDRERVAAAVAAAVAEGRHLDVESRVVWPDGSIHWLAATATVLCDAVGRPTRMIGITTEVTERRRLEESLRERAEQLVDADRRKDEFLAMLAHELRNPLAPLSMSLQLLGLDVPNRERFLDMADRQVKHLVRLVDDLLDVSRITRGKITLRREPLLLADVVARAVELSRPLVDARSQTLTVSLPPERLRLEADAVRLVQVLANLLSNASKYTPTSGSIWLTAEQVGGEIVIRVRDSGVGIAPELLPRVFDMFVQGDASIDRARGGLGIGLTLVRALAELHGGHVRATSPGPGLGSEFVVHLPALPPGPPEPEPPPAARGVAGGRLRVLVVEDNEDAADSLRAMLELWGHEVRVAFDGAAALAVAESAAPDVILSDIGLPGMDGYELARRLRARPECGRVVLIALSGYGRDEDRRRSADAGFDHHLVKPPDVNVLLDLIGRVSTDRRSVALGRAAMRGPCSAARWPTGFAPATTPHRARGRARSWPPRRPADRP